MKKKKRKSGNIVIWLISIGTGFIIGLFFSPFSQVNLESFVNRHSFFAVLLISAFFAFLIIFLHVLVHEAGHLIGGLLSGYRFISFRIFNVMWIKREGKIRCGRYKLPGTGGQCLMSPSEEKGGKYPCMLYNLGGSLANLLLSGLTLLLLILFRNPPWISNLLYFVSSMGILMALINGIPLQLGTVNNDGYNAFHLNKNATTKHSFWLQLKINEMISKGVRLKDMPEEWFAVPASEDMRDGINAAMGAAACSLAMDRMDFAEAWRIGCQTLENAEGLIDIHRYGIITDLLYCEVIGANRKEVVSRMITEKLCKYQKAFATHPSWIRTGYAYELLCRNDIKAVEKKLADFEKIKKRYPYSCEIESETELITHAREIYNARMKAAEANASERK